MAETWNASDVGGSISITGSGLIANSSGTQVSGWVRGTSPIAGKKYFEVEHTYNDWYTDTGFANALFGGSDQLYSTTNSFSWSNDGSIYYNGGTPYFAGSPVTGDRSCFAIDEPNRKAWWRRYTAAGASMGGWLSTGGDPALGTGGYTIPFSGSIYPAVELYNDSGGPALQLTMKALAAAIIGPVPSGFSAYDPGSIVVSDFFRPVLRADHLLRR